MAKKPIEYVNIEIDGKPCEVPSQQVLLWSARDLGYDIPHFCAHKWLEPLGACRLCLVKIETARGMMPKLQTACSTLPAEGMKVYTKHPEVIQARREQIEFHLLNHPLECPVCDKGGECMLQDQTMDHGLQEGRFAETKRVRPDAMFNPYIRHNYKRCIHCKRCTAYCSDIDGSYLLRMNERGAESLIESFPDPDEAPRFSGNVIDICPVGALTARNYRFKMGRVWEQELRTGVGSHDSVGANLWLCTRLGAMARIVPRPNIDIDNGLIDDVTRFSWECFDDDRRLTRAIVRGAAEESVSRHSGEWEAAKRLLEVIGEQGGDSVGVIAGAGLNTEELLALKLFSSTALSSAQYHLGDELFGAAGPDAGELAACTGHIGQISDVLAASTVLTLGCDLFDEAPPVGLRLDVAARRGELKLLSARSHHSEGDRHVKHFAAYLPGDLLRTVRGLVNALTGAGEVPDGVKALAEELKSVGDDCAILFGQEVWRDADVREILHELLALRTAVAQANGNVAVHLNPVFPQVNSAGAMLVNYLRRFATHEPVRTKPPLGSLQGVLEAAVKGQVKALVIVDEDILTTYPDRALVERAFQAVEQIIYIGPFPTATSERAHVHLPLGTFGHREGTVFSMEWRMQRRSRAAIDSVGPSVLDVLNSISVGMDLEHVAGSIDDLLADLVRYVPELPNFVLSKLPDDGVLVKLKNTGETAAHKAELPAAVKVEAGTLALVPKRFLYNDRQEIRYSRVFDPVARPFRAFLNPVDATAQGLENGTAVTLTVNGHELVLPVKQAAWVMAGTVVVNDYCAEQPVNRLAGRGAVRVTLNKMSGEREG